MFALTRGELAMVLLISALIWSAGVLPRLGERVGAWLAKERAQRGPRDGG